MQPESSPAKQLIEQLEAQFPSEPHTAEKADPASSQPTKADEMAIQDTTRRHEGLVQLIYHNDRKAVQLIGIYIAVTLSDGSAKHLSAIDVLSFYAAPVLCGTLFYILTEKVDEKMAERLDTTIVSAFAIFAALLFNLQVLILNARSSTNRSTTGTASAPSPEDVAWERRKIRNRLSVLSEVFANLSYAIAVAILLVAFTMIFIFFGVDQKPIVKAIQLSAVIHFTLTLLMILKRMHLVLSGAEAGH
jgi:hypothetical protein